MQQLREWDPLDLSEKRVWIAAAVALGSAGVFAAILAPITTLGGRAPSWVVLRALLYVGFIASVASVAFRISPGGGPDRSTSQLGSNRTRAAVAGAWLAPAFLCMTLDSAWALLAAACFGVSIATILAPSVPVGGEPGAAGSAGASLPFRMMGARPRRVWTRAARFKLAAIAAYGSAVSAAAGEIEVSVLLAAVGSLGFAWSLGSMDPNRRPPSRAVRRTRLAASLACASALTIAVLDPRLSRAYGAPTLPAGSGDYESSTTGRYSSVVLLADLPSTESAMRPPTSRAPAPFLTATTIPFSGEYWFFYWPVRRPGPQAHTRRGDPISFTYTSTDDSPLTMQARQTLSVPLDTGCCRAIDVVLESTEVRPDTVFVELILLASGPGPPASQSLGTLPLSLPSRVQVGRLVRARTSVRFPIPRDSLVRAADELAVWFHLDESRGANSAKLAIDRFELVP